MSTTPELNTSGVIAALDAEARSAHALTQHGWRLYVSGMGAGQARRAADQMFATGVRRVLVWGTAGGLDPALRPGTLFIPDVVLDAESGVQHPVSAAFHAQLNRALSKLTIPLIHQGLLVTVKQALFTPEEKLAAGRETGALMVDMETAAIADAAAVAGAEFATVRVLVDSADASLPPAVVAAVNTVHPHLGVMFGLLKRPQDLPAVLHLGQSFRHAHRSLVAAAEALVRN